MKKHLTLPQAAKLLREVKRSYRKNLMTLEGLVNNRELMAKVYDKNFGKIQASEKQSEEHVQLLVIENALNEMSIRIISSEIVYTERINAIKERINGLEKRLGIYGKEQFKWKMK